MRLVSIALNDVRRFTDPVKISSIGPGLNVLSAPNENGKSTPGAFWTHNNSDGNFIYNLTAGLFSPHGRPESETTTSDEDITTGVQTRHQVEHFTTEFSRLTYLVYGAAPIPLELRRQCV